MNPAGIAAFVALVLGLFVYLCVWPLVRAWWQEDAGESPRNRRVSFPTLSPPPSAIARAPSRIDPTPQYQRLYGAARVLAARAAMAERRGEPGASDQVDRLLRLLRAATIARGIALDRPGTTVGTGQIRTDFVVAFDDIQDQDEDCQRVLEVSLGRARELFDHLLRQPWARDDEGDVSCLAS